MTLKNDNEYTDPLEIWSSDQKYDRAESITKAQSLKKLKRDCALARGKWELINDEEKKFGYVSGKCTLDQVIQVMADDILFDFTKQNRPEDMKLPRELQNELRKRWKEENFGVSQLIVNHPEEKYMVYPLTVFGFVSTASWEHSGINLITEENIKEMHKYNRKRKFKDDISHFATKVKVDFRSGVGTSPYTPKSIKENIPTKGVDLPTSTGSVDLLFKKPKKCVITGTGEKNDNYRIPKDMFGNAREDIELTPITEVRIDCYL